MPARFGGVERHVHDLSIELDKRGFDITVYGRSWYTKHSLPRIDGIRTVHLSSLRSKYFDTITHTLLATIHALRERHEVIHYHGVGPSLWSFIPRIFSPKTLVITTFHSIDRKHEKWGWFARLILRLGEWTTCNLAHRTIAVSQTIRQYARDVYDCDAEFIPNAVRMYEKTDKQEYLATWGLEPGSYVLMVSRLIPHKGAHYLIEAHKKLKFAGLIDKDTKLAIVGDGYYTDAYVRSLQVMAEQNDDIVFTGFQSGEALTQLFSHAKLMVHPSDKEGLPINVLEGMSYSLPVLLSDIPEHLELTNSPDYLFAHSQVLSLKDRLLRLLQTDVSTLADQGKKNRQQIKDVYHWDVVIDEIIGLYANARSERKVDTVQRLTV